MTDDREQYDDCDRCGARYVGADAIRSYLREDPTADGAVQACCTTNPRIATPSEILQRALDDGLIQRAWVRAIAKEIEAEGEE